MALSARAGDWAGERAAAHDGHFWRSGRAGQQQRLLPAGDRAPARHDGHRARRRCAACSGNSLCCPSDFHDPFFNWEAPKRLLANWSSACWLGEA